MDTNIANINEPVALTRLQRRQIADVLKGRRNELASFYDRQRRDENFPWVAKVALERDLDRYSRLTKLIEPQPLPQEEEEDFNEEED